MMAPIPGLRYVSEYLDRETHDRLLTAVDQHQWLMSVDHRVQIYGYTYRHATRSTFRIGDLPQWAAEIGVRLCDDGLLPQFPDQMVANDYQPGSGIFAHVDQAVLGDIVASVSLGSTCMMRFSNSETRRTEELLLEPRSVLVLSGEARWAWQHEIPARAVDIWQNEERHRARRVSLTFRVIPPAPADRALTDVSEF
jgi:alkylated DNA repair dioxygenase AlkB